MIHHPLQTWNNILLILLINNLNLTTIEINQSLNLYRSDIGDTQSNILKISNNRIKSKTLQRTLSIEYHHHLICKISIVPYSRINTKLVTTKSNPIDNSINKLMIDTHLDIKVTRYIRSIKDYLPIVTWLFDCVYDIPTQKEVTRSLLTWNFSYIVKWWHYWTSNII